MKTIFVNDSVTLLEPWRTPDVTAQDSTSVVADESGLDGSALLAHRMANAWRSTVSAADAREVDAINADRNELDGPALQAHRMANAWKSGK